MSLLKKKSILKICSTFHFKGALCHLEIKNKQKDKCTPHGCVQIGPAHQDDAHRRPAANCPYALPQERTHAKVWVHGLTLPETIAPIGSSRTIWLPTPLRSPSTRVCGKRWKKKQTLNSQYIKPYKTHEESDEAIVLGTGTPCSIDEIWHFCGLALNKDVEGYDLCVKSTWAHWANIQTFNNLEHYSTMNHQQPNSCQTSVFLGSPIKTVLAHYFPTGLEVDGILGFSKFWP